MSGTKLRKPLSKKTGNTLWIHSHGRTFSLTTQKLQAGRKSSLGEARAADGLLVSPMPGKILKITLKEDQKVNAGETVCILEAMKMEYSLKAPFDGLIKKIYKKSGDPVSLDEKIIEIKKQ